MAAWSARLGLASIAAALACSPSAPADFADHDQVVAAQAKWCDALGRLTGDGWTQGAACKAASPSGSAEFIALMVECYNKQVDELGEHDAGTAALRRQCTDIVLERWDTGDATDTAVVQARCERMERCQNTSKADCLKSFLRLSATQRNALSSMYNEQAQHQVTTCLDEPECTTNEDGLQSRCYDEVFNTRVWVP
jgi:hypothetical protein